jgi:hypothetical protein
LLALVVGHNLKEESLLWESFINLKKARNSFVHEGIPQIGNQPVSEETALKLINATEMIIAKVREWIPPELQWPVFLYNTHIEAIGKIPLLPPH